MQATERTEIRLLFESDIPAAMELKNAAGWNQTEADWRRLLMLEPDGCFGAVKNDRLVGTTTAITYKNDLAWIGMVLVELGNRRQGIATRLMETVLDYLNGKVATVKLDATPEGKPVYERFGFQAESLVERWYGPANPKSLVLGNESENVDRRHSLYALDQQAFSADRSELIRSLIQDSLVAPAMISTGDGNLCGYALVRRGTKANYIGPLVTSEPGQIESLLDQALNRLSGSRVYIDFNTECCVSPRLLSDRGFVKERDLIRMSTGSPSKKTSAFVIAIAGPEIG